MRTLYSRGLLSPVAALRSVGKDCAAIAAAQSDLPRAAWLAPKSMPVEPVNVPGSSYREGGAGSASIALEGAADPAAGDQLFGGNGNDVLIAGTGRPALDPGTGNDRIIVPQRMGELRVTPSAAGQLLPLLARVYTLRSIAQGSGPPAGQEAVPNPILLGPADLRDPQFAPLLQQTYDAGQAVALTDATAADAARLRRLLGQPNAVRGPAPGKRAALIFFRKAPRPGTKAYDYATGSFIQAPTPASPAASRRSDEQNIALLSRVFSATAIVPEALAGAPSDDLLQLADSYTTSNIARNTYGGSVQLVSSVWNVRSFLNQADFY